MTSVGLEKIAFSHIELLVNQCFEKLVAVLTQLETTESLGIKTAATKTVWDQQSAHHLPGIWKGRTLGTSHLQKEKPLKHQGKVKCLSLESLPSKSRAFSWKEIHHLNHSVTDICKVL